MDVHMTRQELRNIFKRFCGKKVKFVHGWIYEPTGEYESKEHIGVYNNFDVEFERRTKSYGFFYVKIPFEDGFTFKLGFWDDLHVKENSMPHHIKVENDYSDEYENFSITVLDL